MLNADERRTVGIELIFISEEVNRSQILSHTFFACKSNSSLTNRHLLECVPRRRDALVCGGVALRCRYKITVVQPTEQC
jgi:hypothetical protein